MERSRFAGFHPARDFSFLSSLKETKQRKVRKRPELGGRNHDFSKHSMNSLRSNSISYFVAQIACCNPRLNIASKNHTSYKCLLVRNVFEGAKRQRRLPHFVLHVFSNLILENIPHEEVFRGCTIIGIFFDSCIAKARQANRHEKLSERSEFLDKPSGKAERIE